MTDLRGRAARGTIVNGAFMVGLNLLALLQGVLVARLLPTEAYGEWGLLMAAFMTLITLGSVGIDDKFLQQEDEDQVRAFEIAFSLQLLLVPVFLVVLGVGMPLLALLYDRPEIIAPGLVLALSLPALALQAPLWVHYRRMDFVRQRLLGTIDPLVTLVVTVALAAAGLGVWALVWGALAGSYAAGLTMAATSPYRLRWRFDRAALREYRSFSWPLLVGALSTVLLVQGPVIAGSRALGIQAVAAIALATTISQFAHRVDELVTQSMYPALCRVQDRRELLFEAFWKSNRLALLWGAPFGVAIALFAADVVPGVLGDKWRFATTLIALYGLVAVVRQIAFNWTAFVRALGDTRPIAVAGAVDVVAVLGLAVPLLVLEGLTAFGIGLGVVALIGLAVRLAAMRRVLPGRPLLRAIAGGLLPTVPAALLVLGLRWADAGPRGTGRVLAEMALYVAVAAAASLLTERRLLVEAVGYLRRRRTGVVPA